MDIKMLFHKVENIMVERLGDRMLLFDLDTNLPFILNSVAAYIFTKTDGKRDCREIAKKVSQKFDVEFEQALSDVENISQTFLKKKMLSKIYSVDSHYRTG
jgi:hypothetical protein